MASRGERCVVLACLICVQLLAFGCPHTIRATHLDVPRLFNRRRKGVGGSFGLLREAVRAPGAYGRLVFGIARNTVGGWRASEVNLAV